MAIKIELFKKLVDSPAVSGSEENISQVLMKELKPYVQEVRIDKIGNLISRIGSGSPKIMLAAHMDEIGLMVKHINKEGFIIFDKVGGWDDRIMPTKKLLIHGSKGPVLGVIGYKPIHLQAKEEQTKPYKFKDMFIDIGASSESEVKKAGISVGDFITNYSPVESLCGSRITGHAFDNRIGCYVLLEVAKRVKNFKGSLYLVGTVKEEIGLVGVRGSTFNINPDVMLALDTSIAGDTPGLTDFDTSVKLGKGPSFELKDAINVVHPKVKKWMLDTAAKSKINIQLDVMSAGATDASIVPMIREGILSGSLTVPVRYIHAPVEMADMKDIENCVKLCVSLVNSAHAYF